MASLEPPRQNSILSTLNAAAYAVIRGDLETITLKRGDVLYSVGGHIRHVYFPRTALISLIGISAAGQAVEVGMVGFEGFVGVPILLGVSSQPYQAVTQLGGTLWRLPKEALDPINGRACVLTAILLRYTHVRITQVIQSAICNRFHSMRQRLCRWLLTARDRRQSDDLEFTKEYLADMIGSQRPGVASTLSSLERLKLLKSHRGGVTILRGKDLENESCECYALVKREVDNFAESCENHGPAI